MSNVSESKRAVAGDKIRITKDEWGAPVDSVCIVIRSSDDVYYSYGNCNTAYASHSAYEIIPEPSTDELVSRLASLAASYSALEKRVSTIEEAKSPKPLVTSSPAKLAPKAITRQDVIDRALKDVAELEKRMGTMFSADIPAVEKRGGLVVKYVINRDKRTVCALLHRRFAGGRVCETGKSRCTIDDVFNAHIGKAIALRRALGLDVPAEYTNAPQPTSLKPGDIVRLRGGSLYTTTQHHSAGSFHEKIIDDSRLAVA